MVFFACAFLITLTVLLWLLWHLYRPDKPLIKGKVSSIALLELKPEKLEEVFTEQPNTPTDKTNPGYFLLPSGSNSEYFVLQDSFRQDTDI